MKQMETKAGHLWYSMWGDFSEGPVTSWKNDWFLPLDSRDKLFQEPPVLRKRVLVLVR